MTEKHPFPYGSIESLVSFINRDYGTCYRVQRSEGDTCIVIEKERRLTFPSYIKAFAYLLVQLEQLYREHWFVKVVC